MRLLSSAFEKIVSFLFPYHCLNCKKVTPFKYFCKACKNSAAYITVKTCSDCGLPMKYCACKWNFYYFDEIISCFEADDATKRSFYSFKFGGNLIGGEFFADEMAKRIKNNYLYSDMDVIASVPSHITTRRERGYDQVKILAKNISRKIKVKYVPLLCQPKHSPKQHETQNIADRFLNVSGKYRVLKKAKVKDKTILLVDDIKTTGATLSQCARELKLAGAKSVIVVTALTVYPKKDSIEKLKD